MAIFAYIVENSLLCPQCGKGRENAKECQSKDYSYGHEVIGCYECGETLKTPF